MNNLSTIISNEFADYKQILVKKKLNKISIDFADDGRVLNLTEQARKSINNTTNLLAFLNIILKCYLVKRINRDVHYNGENLFIEQCLLTGKTKFLNNKIMKCNYVLELPYVNAMAETISTKFKYVNNASCTSERRNLNKLKVMINLVNVAIVKYLRKNFVINRNNKLSKLWCIISHRVSNFKSLSKVNAKYKDTFGYSFFRQIYKQWSNNYKHHNIKFDVYFRAIFISMNIITEEIYCHHHKKNGVNKLKLNDTRIQPSYENLFTDLQKIDIKLQKILCHKE